MKFVIALVSYLESLGYDTSSLRKSADGSKAIVHMQYAEILSKNLDTNANVTIYDRVNPDFQALLASDEWNGNVTGTPNSFGDLAELAKYEARLTAKVTEAKTDMDNFQTEIAGKVTTAKEDLNAIVDNYQVTVNQQLEQNVNDTTTSKRALNYYWLPETQPPARTDNEGYFIDAFVGNADYYINNYFEPLRLANPNYISRISMGKDQSGLYDVWKYSFTPKNYQKTIILSSCMHGSEVSLMVAMIRFLNYLTNDWEKYPELAYIRENVRIIYVPIVNPWGISQSPRTRQNSNGVDLNRNFDYKWSDYPTGAPFDHDYKGSAPFSEVETQYIKSLVETHTDFIAYVDFHNVGSPARDYFLYLPEKYNFKTYDKLLAYFTKDIVNPDVYLNINAYPTASNYILTQTGKPASHPEWCDGRFSTQKYDSGDITQSLAWIANVIIEHCREFDRKETFVIENYYTRSTTNLNIASGTYAEIPEFRFEFDAPFDGVVIVDGVIVLSPSDPSALNYICPSIVQGGTDFSSYIPSVQRDEVYAAGPSRSSIAFQTQSYISKDGVGLGRVRFGLFAFSTAGTTTVYRYRCRITVIPTSDKQRYRIFTANGRESEGVGAMQLIYP